MCSTICPARCIQIEGADAPWEDRDKYPTKFVIDELRCIYCGMCEEACPVDAIELTSIYDLTGASRQEMLFDKEKLLGVHDQTAGKGKDPIRTKRGVLVMAPWAGEGAVVPGAVTCGTVTGGAVASGAGLGVVAGGVGQGGFPTPYTKPSLDVTFERLP